MPTQHVSLSLSLCFLSMSALYLYILVISAGDVMSIIFSVIALTNGGTFKNRSVGEKKNAKENVRKVVSKFFD